MFAGLSATLALVVPIVQDPSRLPETLVLLPIVMALVLIARTLPAEDRPIAMLLFVTALALRIGLLGILTVTDTSFLTLGPDAQEYLRQSLSLASSSFATDIHPVTFFGSYDVAHYYLFGLTALLFGADLYGLELLNCGLAALVAPLMFAWARSVIPNFASSTAGLIAVHPSLVVMAATSLLKDPSILFASVLALWSGTLMFSSPRGRNSIGYGIVAVLAIVYLRLDRSYVVAIGEVAMLAVAVRMMLKTGLRPGTNRRVLGVGVLVLLVAEALPWGIGWPPSPVQAFTSLEHVRSTAAIRDYPPGLVQRLAAEPAASAVGAVLGAATTPDPAHLIAQPPTIPTPESIPVEAPLPQLAGSSVAHDPQPAEGPARSAEQPSDALLIGLADVFRRLYGPFVWVRGGNPSDELIFQSDLGLFPGMLIWYALLPFMVLGMTLIVVRFIRGLAQNRGLEFLALFSMLYFAMYLGITLSYRQRDVLTPLLLVFVPPAVLFVRRFKLTWLGYTLYWLGLIFVASIHLTLRALANS